MEKTPHTIYDAVHQLCVYNYSSLECFKTIHNLFYYIFSNISKYKRSELAKQWMDTMVSHTPSTDAHYAKLLYHWYHSIEKRDIIGYPTSILDNKTQDIVKLIHGHKHKIFIEIGSGDCQLARDITAMLHMKPVSVSIPHGHKSKRYKFDTCSQIHAITYDKHFIKRIRSFPEKVGAILFNHALHHFSSNEAIQRALQEAYFLLEKGGILVIRDHQSVNDMFIDLQHVVFEMKYSMELPMKEYEEHIKKYISSLKTHYFNVKIIKEWCKQIGFTYRSMLKNKSHIKDVCNQEVDISNTVYLCFQKQDKTRKI
jgi:hypothetical protein